MKFSTKLTLSITLVALIAAPVLGLTVFYSAQNVLKESIGNNQLEFARHSMDEIDMVLHGAYQDIQVIAEANPIENPLSARSSATSTQELGNLDAMASNRLDEFMIQTGPWDILFLVDKNGTVVASSEEEKVGKRIFKEPQSNLAYEMAMLGEVYYSDLVISEETGKPTVIFAAPVRNKEKVGRPVVGAVIGNFAWPVILELLDKVIIGQVHLFNKDGMTIATLTIDREEILKHDLSHTDTVKQALKGECGSIISISGFIMKEKNVPALSSCALQNGYLGYKGSGWGFIIEVPQSVAFAPINQMARNFVLVIIIIIGLAILAFYFLGKQLTKPVESLRKVAQAIVAGDLSIRAEVKSKDEIGQLAQSFNQMTDSLIKSGEYLDNLFKTMPGSLLVVNSNAKIRMINPMTCELLGYKKEELIGKPVEKIFGATAATTAVFIFKGAGLEKLIKQGTIKDEQMIYLTKKGKKIPVAVSGTVVYKTEEQKTKKIKKQIDYIVVIAKDLRELKEYAQERLAEITPALQKVALGDFSEKIEIPEKEDEFTEHLVALNLMVDDFREMMEEIQHHKEELEGQNEELEETSAELEESKIGLEGKVKERTKELERAKLGLEKKVQERTKELEKAKTGLEVQVTERTHELQDKLVELERFNKITMGREVRILGLKDEVARLKSEQKVAKTVTSEKILVPEPSIAGKNQKKPKTKKM